MRHAGDHLVQQGGIGSLLFPEEPFVEARRTVYRVSGGFPRSLLFPEEPFVEATRPVLRALSVAVSLLFPEEPFVEAE